MAGSRKSQGKQGEEGLKEEQTEVVEIESEDDEEVRWR